ncbi:hypothetical protein AB4Z54_62025, partial [Streptomyces sp. MCAF7]
MSGTKADGPDEPDGHVDGGIKPLAVSDPARIGPYLLLGRLGAGGMGRVFLARSDSGRTVAVKVVHEEHVSLLGRLGAGGMGRVFLARSDSGRTVAVKVVHEEHVS